MNSSIMIFFSLLLLITDSDAVTNSQYFLPRYTGSSQPDRPHNRLPPYRHPIPPPSHYYSPPSPIFAKLFEVFDYNGPFVKFDDEYDDFFDGHFRKPGNFFHSPQSGPNYSKPFPSNGGPHHHQSFIPPIGRPNHPQSFVPIGGPYRPPTSSPVGGPYRPPTSSPNGGPDLPPIFRNNGRMNHPSLFVPSQGPSGFPAHPPFPNERGHEEAYRRYRDYFYRRFGTNLSE